jgi:hypothetical protein
MRAALLALAIVLIELTVLWVREAVIRMRERSNRQSGRS